jgi:hypothetical protein
MCFLSILESFLPLIEEKLVSLLNTRVSRAPTEYTAVIRFGCPFLIASYRIMI